MNVASGRTFQFSTENESAQSFFSKFVLSREFVIKTLDYTYSLIVSQISQIDHSAERFFFVATMVKATSNITGLSCYIIRKSNYIGYFSSQEKLGWIESKKKTN